MANANDALNAFLNTFTEEQLNTVFPVGLRTPGATIARLAKYHGAGFADTDSLIQYISQHRNDPDWAAGRGHKRAALIPFIAIVAHASAATGRRAVSDRMRIMITTQFPREYCVELVRLMRLAFDVELDWRKDGAREVIRVPAEVAADADIQRWCLIEWPNRR